MRASIDPVALRLLLAAPASCRAVMLTVQTRAAADRFSLASGAKVEVAEGSLSLVAVPNVRFAADLDSQC